jgi:hypothetical protein
MAGQERRDVAERREATGTALTPVIRPQSFNELVQFAQMAARSTMVPNDYRGKPENIMLAVQMGSEVGLAPMQALQNIAVINGRPALWGDAMLALCKQSSKWGGIEETLTGEGDDRVATCTVKRGGEAPVVRHFAVRDAIRAGLWLTSPSTSPWYRYPMRMLQMRARGWALRDTFPDVLRGLQSAEEATDTPREPFVGTTIDASPETAPAPQSAPRSEPSQSSPGQSSSRPAPPGPASEPRPQRAPESPPPQARRTIGDLMQDIEQALDAARSVADVLRITDRKDVQWLNAYAAKDVRDKLNEMKRLAYEKWQDIEAAAALERDDPLMAGEADVPDDGTMPATLDPPDASPPAPPPRQDTSQQRLSDRPPADDEDQHISFPEDAAWIEYMCKHVTSANSLQQLKAWRAYPPMYRRFQRIEREDPQLAERLTNAEQAREEKLQAREAAPE